MKACTPLAPPSELPGTQLPGAQLPGTQLPGTQLPGTQLPGAQLPGTQLPGTEAPRVNVALAEAPRVKVALAPLAPRAARLLAADASIGAMLVGLLRAQPVAHARSHLSRGVSHTLPWPPRVLSAYLDYLRQVSHAPVSPPPPPAVTRPTFA